MSATCEHPDDEARLYDAVCPGCAALMAHGRRQRPSYAPRPGVENLLAAGGPWVSQPTVWSSTPSRPIAELRADLAELASVLAVWCDLLEWRGAAAGSDSRAAELVRQRDAIAARITGSVIAGRLPGDQQGELMALLDVARPGSWFGDDDADGRMLDQEQTNTLIRAELWSVALHRFEQACGYDRSLREIFGERGSVRLDLPGADIRRLGVIAGDQTGMWKNATHQRGGIDSHPLVRLLAFRAWGDRDRRWFEERGVRKGEVVAFVRRTNPISVCALLWPGESAIGTAVDDARPGQVAVLDPGGRYTHQLRYQVSDRPRTSPRP